MTRTRAAALLLGGVVLVSACSSARGEADPVDIGRTTSGAGEPVRASGGATPAVLSAVAPAREVAAPAVPSTVRSTPVSPATAVSTPTPVKLVNPTTPRSRLSFVTPVSNLRATPIKAVGADSGTEMRRIQSRLIELGFWLQAVDGNYGLSTRQALMAFQKYAGIEATGEADRATAEALTNATRRAEAAASDVSLVEIDKAKQLLFIVENGRTMWVFNTSTGNGKPYREVNQNTGRIEEDVAITPNGLWKITRERHDGWWDGDLGQIYRPKYFKGGIAIHGMNNVPNYPASHGCVRLSLPAMDYIWDNELIPKGTTIWVHEGP